jgi:predicted DNA-binding protein
MPNQEPITPSFPKEPTISVSINGTGTTFTHHTIKGNQMKIFRHHLRLDEQTQAALTHLSKATLQTKSSIMRRFIQDGIARERDSSVPFQSVTTHSR